MLEVSADAYQEISDRIKEADQEERFFKEAPWDVVIDMDGIAVGVEQNPSYKKFQMYVRVLQRGESRDGPWSEPEVVYIYPFNYTPKPELLEPYVEQFHGVYGKRQVFHRSVVKLMEGRVKL